MMRVPREWKIARCLTGGGIKRWLEDISVEMGLDGEITKAVKKEAEKRLKKIRSKPDKKAGMDDIAQELVSVARELTADSEGYTNEDRDAIIGYLDDARETILRSLTHSIDGTKTALKGAAKLAPLPLGRKISKALYVPADKMGGDQARLRRDIDAMIQELKRQDWDAEV